MPATPFDPVHAVIAHSLVSLDPSTLEILQPEDYLLVHACPCSATNDTLQEVNSDGKLVLYVAYNFQLVWSVEADILAVSGLANYHPGAALSTNSLAFLNGATKPFQYPATETGPSSTVGRMVYESPVRTPVPGGLTGLTFQIRQIFNDNNETDYDPGDPDDGSSLPPELGTDYEFQTGAALIWYRTVNLIGPTGHPLVYGYKMWYTLPAGTPPPADLTDFLAHTDNRPQEPGVNVITEVFDCTVPDGNYLLDSPGHIIQTAVEGGGTPVTPTTWNFCLEFRNVVDLSYAGYELQPQTDPPSTTAAEVIAAYSHPPEDEIEIIAIYDVWQAVWLLWPPEPEPEP